MKQLSLGLLSINKQAFRIHTDSLKRLTQLSFNSCDICQKLLSEILNQADSLDQLSLSYCSIITADGGLTPSHKSLKSLRLDCNQLGFQLSHVKFFAGFQTQRRLTLTLRPLPGYDQSLEAEFEDRGITLFQQKPETFFDVVKDIFNCPSVKTLRLKNIDLSKHTTSLSVCTNLALQDLQFTNCVGVTDELVLNILQNAPYLHSLIIEGSLPLTGSCFNDSSLTSNLTRLTVVHLQDCSLQGKHILNMLRLLAKSPLDHLSVVSLTERLSVDFQKTVFDNGLFNSEPYKLNIEGNRRTFCITKNQQPPATPPRVLLETPSPKGWFRSILDRAGSFLSWIASLFRTNS